MFKRSPTILDQYGQELRLLTRNYNPEKQKLVMVLRLLHPHSRDRTTGGLPQVANLWPAGTPHNLRHQIAINRQKERKDGSPCQHKERKHPNPPRQVQATATQTNAREELPPLPTTRLTKDATFTEAHPRRQRRGEKRTHTKWAKGTTANKTCRNCVAVSTVCPAAISRKEDTRSSFCDRSRRLSIRRLCCGAAKKETPNWDVGIVAVLGARRREARPSLWR